MPISRKSEKLNAPTFKIDIAKVPLLFHIRWYLKLRFISNTYFWDNFFKKQPLCYAKWSSLYYRNCQKFCDAVNKIYFNSMLWIWNDLLLILLRLRDWSLINTFEINNATWKTLKQDQYWIPNYFPGWSEARTISEIIQSFIW